MEVEPDVEKILTGWTENKDNLYKLLGNNLIIEQSISVQKDEGMIQDEIYDVLLSYRAKTRFADMWYQLINGFRWHEFHCDIFCQHPELKNLILNTDSNLKGIIDEGLRSLISSYALSRNIYSGKEFSLPSPIASKSPLKINNGCKTIKAIGKIVDFFGLDKELFEEFRLAHSLCLNQKMLKGTLCLSIHPLDYMTMSDNGYDWNSCMSWIGGGDYRQGTLEMMGSRWVVVAYLKGDEPYKPIYGDFEWSNKKWRQLFVVHKDILLGIKSYPYSNDALTTTTLGILKDLALKNLGWGFPKTISKIDNNKKNILATTKESEVYIYLLMHHMYNDICRGHFAYVNSNIPANFELYLSGPAYCLACGTELHCECEASLLCENCGHSYICDCCDRYTNEPMYINDGDTLVCPDCYYEETAMCPHCGERVWTSDLYEVYLKSGSKGSHFTTGICDYCLNCDTDKVEEILGSIKEYEIQDHGWFPEKRLFVDVGNITPEKIKEYFCIYDMELIEKVFNDSTYFYSIPCDKEKN